MLEVDKDSLWKQCHIHAGENKNIPPHADYLISPGGVPIR